MSIEEINLKSKITTELLYVSGFVEELSYPSVPVFTFGKNSKITTNLELPSAISLEEA